MRPLILGTLALSLAAFTACDIELDDGSGVNAWENPSGPVMSDGALQSRSSNYMRYEGVYVPDEGAGYAVAGMADMTCQLYTNDGYTGTDVDLTTGPDQVDDGKPLDPTRPDFGVLVLGHGPDGVHIVGMPSGEVEQSWSTPGVVGAKFDDEGGFYAVREDRGDCVVDHHDRSDKVTTLDVEDRFCSGDASIESTPDGLLIVDNLGGIVVDERGTAEMPLQARTVTYNDVVQGYHLTSGTTMTMVDDAGDTIWATDLGGEAQSHADLGTWQVASIRVDSQNSRLLVIDSETGAIESSQTIERPAGKVYGSDDGKTVVVSTGFASDAFSLR